MENQSALAVVSKISPIGSKQSMIEKVSDLLIEVNTATVNLSSFIALPANDRPSADVLNKLTQQLGELHTTLVEAFAIISETQAYWLDKSVPK